MKNNKFLPRFVIKPQIANVERVKISSSRDAYNVIKQFYHEDISIYESFFILCLDRANNTVGYAKISQGGVSGTVVDVKLIMKYALDNLSSSVILAHNHPSGTLKPSVQDINLTKKVQAAGLVMDINIHDHIVLTPDGYFSMSDESYM